MRGRKTIFEVKDWTPLVVSEVESPKDTLTIEAKELSLLAETEPLKA